ncbi:hypothetical protein D3C81_2132680 [compost metagenome]
MGREGTAWPPFLPAFFDTNLVNTLHNRLNKTIQEALGVFDAFTANGEVDLDFRLCARGAQAEP